MRHIFAGLMAVLYGAVAFDMFRTKQGWVTTLPVMAAVAFGAIAVAGCANVSPSVGPVSGTVNIGSSKPELVPVVKTIVEKCAPPQEWLVKADPLAAIFDRRLPPKRLLDIAIKEGIQYRLLKLSNDTLIEWIKGKCQ